MIIHLEKTKIKNKRSLIVKLKETRNFSKYIFIVDVYSFELI